MHTRRFIAAVALPGCALLATTACQPRLGTFLPKSVDNATYAYTDCDIVTEAQALGVDIQRVQQVVESDGLNTTVVRLADAGIDSHLTFKANGRSTALLPDDPDVPGDENAATGTTVTEFRAELGQRLDEYQALTGGVAPLIAIENEANHDQFYNGTAQDYLTELAIATDVAHEHGVKITDSGVATKAVKLVAWNHLRVTRGTGVADTYLRTVFRSTDNPDDTPIRDQLLGVSQSDPDPYAHLSGAALRSNWLDAETMLDAFGNGTGQVPIDYVNFHWYTPDETNPTPYSDRQALTDTIDAFSEITGLPVVTNEIGKHGNGGGTDTAAVSDTLDVTIKEKKLALVIWFDADGNPADGLFEPTNPGQLRPTGETFRTYTTSATYEPSACG